GLRQFFKRWDNGLESRFIGQEILGLKRATGFRSTIDEFPKRFVSKLARKGIGWMDGRGKKQSRDQNRQHDSNPNPRHPRNPQDHSVIRTIDVDSSFRYSSNDHFGRIGQTADARGPMKKLVIILGCLFGILLLVIAAVWLFFDVNHYRGVIQTQLEQQLGRK